MILFKKYHVPLILNLVKDITRRGGKKRWNEGAFHQLKTGFRANDVFAGAKILKVYEEPFGNITDEHVQREGYESRPQYFEAYLTINKLTMIDLDKPVWVVIFNVSGLMQIKIRDGIVGLLHYEHPIIENMRKANVFQKNLYRMTPVEVCPSQKFISWDLEKWRT